MPRYVASPRHPLVSKLHQEMCECGYNYRQVSFEADLNPGTLSKWFNGNQSPSLFHFERLANALGFDLILVRNEERSLG